MCVSVCVASEVVYRSKILLSCACFRCCLSFQFSLVLVCLHVFPYIVVYGNRGVCASNKIILALSLCLSVCLSACLPVFACLSVCIRRAANIGIYSLEWMCVSVCVCARVSMYSERSLQMNSFDTCFCALSLFYYYSSSVCFLHFFRPEPLKLHENETHDKNKNVLGRNVIMNA